MATKANHVNEKQNIEIGQLKTDISWIREKICNIEKAVFNEIPHQLEDLRKEREDQIRLLRMEIRDLTNKIVFGMIVVVATTLILQIISEFLKS